MSKLNFISAVVLAVTFVLLALIDQVLPQPSISGTFEICFGGGSCGTEFPGPSQALFNSPYYSCTTNRYVSTTGNNSNNGTASDDAHAWLTIAHADTTTPTAGTCINVLPGTYAAGTNITHGGNAASSTGYVVYRCTTLDGCTITDSGNNGTTSEHAAISVEANYVQVDGFVFSASSPQGADTGALVVYPGTLAYTFSNHHIWALNNIASGYGEEGLFFASGEFFYVIHNTFHDNAANASCNGGAQGSGIAVDFPIPISSYSLTADDKNNPVTGNTGTLVRNFVMWNIIYNNRVAGCGGTGASDGNGIIFDTWQWNCSPANSGCTTGAVPYTGGGLAAFNVTYNNGGGGIHIFTSQYIIAANNSCYNNYLDTNNPSVGRGCIDTSLSYGNTIFNNLTYTACGTGVLANGSGVNPNGPYGNGPYTTTLNNGGTLSAVATSIPITSAANFPSTTPTGANSWQSNGSFALPGGNMILIGSEAMLVTAGWGTTTLTVQRGYYGTTAATHADGATVSWLPDYWSNNVSYGVSPCVDGSSLASGNPDLLYSTTQNQAGVKPGWADVGNTSTGSTTTQPNGKNFALCTAAATPVASCVGASPAISYGQTFSWLSAQSIDAGACQHSLTTCP